MRWLLRLSRLSVWRTKHPDHISVLTRQARVTEVALEALPTVDHRYPPTVVRHLQTLVHPHRQIVYAPWVHSGGARVVVASDVSQLVVVVVLA